MKYNLTWKGYLSSSSRSLYALAVDIVDFDNTGLQNNNLTKDDGSSW